MGKFLNLINNLPNTPSNHRKQLLQYCEQVKGPVELLLDAEFGVAALGRTEKYFLAEMFLFFGVTELDPRRAKFDAVLETWFMLHTKVSEDIRIKNKYPDTVYALDAAKWAPSYRAYIEALWEGNRSAILSCAEALNFRYGIAKDARSIKSGPIHQ